MLQIWLAYSHHAMFDIPSIFTSAGGFGMSQHVWWHQRAKKNWNPHLVGGFSPPLWKMMDFVSWDDDIPNIIPNMIPNNYHIPNIYDYSQQMGKKKHVPNHQPARVCEFFLNRCQHTEPQLAAQRPFAWNDWALSPVEKLPICGEEKKQVKPLQKWEIYGVFMGYQLDHGIWMGYLWDD